MCGDKPVVGRIEFGPHKHVEITGDIPMMDEAEKKRALRMLEEKPPRPDVEGIVSFTVMFQELFLRWQASIGGHTKPKCEIRSLCDYTLAVEKERDALKAIEVGASFAKQDRLDAALEREIEANSLLLWLVEAGTRLKLDTFGGHSGHRCLYISYGGTTTDGCDCNFPLFFTALTAAKRYLDKGEK